MKNWLAIEDTLENKITYFHLIAFLLCLPFDRLYSQLALISLTTHTIIHFKTSRLKVLFRKELLLLQSIYILSIITTFYSVHKSIAFGFWEKQLSIFLFPILLLINPINIRKYSKPLLQTFIFINCAATLYLYEDAFNIIRFYDMPLSSLLSPSFLSHNFSAPIGIHATYFSLYCALSLIVSVHSLIAEREMNKRSICLIVAILILSMGLLQLRSRAVLLTTLLLLLLVVPFYLRTKLLQIRYMICAVLIVGLLSIFAYKADSFRQRLANSIESDLSITQSTYSIADSRAKRWIVAWQLVIHSPIFGYGGGEEQILLREAYFNHKLYDSYLNKLNAHNQYISLLLKAGVIGIASYLLTMVSFLMLAIRLKNLPFIAFLVLISITSISENILDVNKGIFFYSFFLSLFAISEFNWKTSQTELTKKHSNLLRFHTVSIYRDILNNIIQILCIKTDILSTLAYFDIFHYPLTQMEIILFSRNNHTNADFYNSLQVLILERRLYQFDEFYTLQNDPSLILRRRNGNMRAKRLLETAEKVAKLLSYFPFVRGIAISGSLSKNYADETSDIDLFIITAKNRLWLARTFMHLLKKLSYLFGKEQLFCMNYFIDEEALEIREKNLYTATEVSTLLPLRGVEAFKSFYKYNGWSRNFLPNHSMRVSYVKDNNISIIKSIIEVCLDNVLGNLADTFLMTITAKRWHKKTANGKLNNRGVVMSMQASKHFAKPDPQSFQNKLISAYEARRFQVIHTDLRKLKPVY